MPNERNLETKGSTDRQFSREELNKVVEDILQAFENWLKNHFQIDLKEKRKITEAFILWQTLINSWAPTENSPEGIKDSARRKFQQFFSQVDKSYKSQLETILESELAKILAL